MQNHSKSKITERLSLPELKDEILQVCHSSADLQIEKWKCRMEEFWQRDSKCQLSVCKGKR